MYELNQLPLTASNALLSLNQSARSSPHFFGNSAVPQVGVPSVLQNGQYPQQYANPAIQHQPTSVINMSHSNDVVIGPMTQYQGPVTIYMDATVEAKSRHSNQGLQQNRITETNTTISQKLQSNLKFGIVLLIVIIIGIGTITYLLLDKYAKQSNDKQILFGNNYETGTFPNLGNGHLVVDREQWGAQNTNGTKFYQLEHPIPYVLVTHVGVQSTTCTNIYRCSIKMRSWQDSAIAEKKLQDISSNFYVGSDGNIYVGRGWDIANSYSNKSLAITFMGDYIRHEPDERQLEAVQYLLSYGLTNKQIALDYKLVAHNQTKKTYSPGVNVYKHIIKWPHWYPCGIQDNPRCGTEIGLPSYWNTTNGI